MSSVKTVLVTGAGGFIARAAARRFAADGFRVVGVSRAGTPVPGYDRVARAALGDSLEPLLAEESVQAVIHAAVHTGADEYRVNVDGTRRWLEETRARGGPLQIFLSTLSARPDAQSAYGRSKFDLEGPFREAGGVVLRLGVVVGNGGMFARIRDSLARSPLVPLLDGGRSRLHVLGIDTLAAVLSRLAAEDGEGFRGEVLHAQEPTSYSLRDLMEAVRRHYGFRCRFVPVPSLPVLWAVAAAERIPGLRLPVTSSNLKGLRQSRHESFPSDFPRFGLPEEGLEALVTRAAARPEKEPVVDSLPGS
jgi:nucleoside-diphosphate-sugar epimerase